MNKDNNLGRYPGSRRWTDGTTGGVAMTDRDKDRRTTQLEPDDLIFRGAGRGLAVIAVVLSAACVLLMVVVFKAVTG